MSFRLSGRGGRVNAHPGNVQFRQHVLEKRETYLDTNTKKLEKAHIAALLVYNIRSMEPPGRFLKEDSDGSWWDIGDQKAIKKVGQAMREFSRGQRGRSGEESAKHVYLPVLHQLTSTSENHDSAATSIYHGFSTEVATINEPNKPALHHMGKPSTVIDAAPQFVVPDHGRAVYRPTSTRESHYSAATSGRHGFSTEFATASVPYRPALQHMDHPSTVVDALRELSRGPTPRSPSQIADQQRVPLTKRDDLDQVTHSSKYNAVGGGGHSQFSLSHDDEPVARHPKLAVNQPQHYNSSSITVEIEKPVYSPSLVAENLSNRTLLPKKANLPTLYPELDHPDKVHLLQQAVSATLDASDETKNPAAPVLADVDFGKDDRSALQPTSSKSTVAATQFGDSILQQALSSTLGGDHDQLQKKKIRVSEEIFGRPLYPTAAALSAIGANNKNADAGASENHTNSPREACFIDTSESSGGGSSSPCPAGAGANQSHKRKLTAHLQ